MSFQSVMHSQDRPRTTSSEDASPSKCHNTSIWCALQDAHWFPGVKHTAQRGLMDPAFGGCKPPSTGVGGASLDSLKWRLD
eukprot:5707272-Alexandrium_andersonii.AAC.1